MTVAETLLVFVGAPLAIIAVLAMLTLLPDRRHKRARYKPGQPWEHPPVWYEPHPEKSAGGGHGPAPTSGPAAVPGSDTASLGSSMYPEQPGERALDDRRGAGVASGSEARSGADVDTRAAVPAGVGAPSGGATAAGAITPGGAAGGATAAGAAAAPAASGATAARRPHPGGPLGGARGTW